MNSHRQIVFALLVGLASVFGAASRGAAAGAGAGQGPVARAHEILTHGMAAAFSVATVFDVCALLVVAAAVFAGRRPRPQAAHSGRPRVAAGEAAR